jgi:hypothetical protein
MKILLRVLILSLGFVQARANDGEPVRTLISERDVKVQVDISTTQVRRSRSGYSAEVLKVLIPDLADVTLLDHRNEGEKAPCMATFQARQPEEIIQNNPAVEKVGLKITLTKVAWVNQETQQCEIHLEEHIAGKIRGFQFLHDREKSIATRSIEDCR